MKSWNLKLLSKQNLEDQILTGPPFQVNIGEKSKSKIRKLLYLSILIWILQIILSLNTDRELFKLSIIFAIVLIPSLILSQQQVVSLSGTHGNWIISRRITFRFFQLQLWKIKTSEFTIQFNIIMNYKIKSAGIIFAFLDLNKKYKLLTHVKIAKEFKDNCDIIGLKYLVKRKGKRI